MNNYALEQAEELFEQALEYFLGIEKEKNMIHAKELLQQSSELGLSKSSNLLGDWYITSNPQLSSSASFLRLNVLSSLN